MSQLEHIEKMEAMLETSKINLESWKLSFIEAQDSLKKLNKEESVSYFGAAYELFAEFKEAKIKVEKKRNEFFNSIDKIVKSNLNR